MNYPDNFDVVIIGGGHAGAEAALASARRGAKTLLVTHNIETLGQMSCNPAIGGIGKGHLVKEIDALGGVMAQAADYAGIHFRILNSRKGAAVRATRAQTDRLLYKKFIRSTLENQEKLYIFQQAVDDIIIKNQRAAGIVTQTGLRIYAASIVLAAGTFLAGKIHIGPANHAGGRAGDPPALSLSANLKNYGFEVKRLKTGTPPRIDRRSIDFSRMIEQPGDEPVPFFSLAGEIPHPQQVSCWITRTNDKTHDIIRSALDRSPIYSGVITGTGPRYCPSIEDKVTRFSHRDSHQIFVEPEGLNSNEIYPNGISTSLPFDIQLALVQSIMGFEKAFITRPGYAIEYDYFDPRGLHDTLETKQIENLFFAGQINGTTGYEEAAAQGLIAGVNAAGKALGKETWSPRRHEAYIGVMIDDLITQGTSEPYRMFTSRAEYRLLLREDNADLRLTAIGRRLGVVDDARRQEFEEKSKLIAKEKSRLKRRRIHPDKPEAAFPGLNLRREHNLLELLKRPEYDYHALMDIGKLEPLANPDVIRQVEIQTKYEGYIKRQQEEISANSELENTELTAIDNYDSIAGLSAELSEKLNRFKPDTLGQAARIQGMTPAAVTVIRIYLRKEKIKC